MENINKVAIGTVQMSCSPDVTENTDKAIKNIRDLAAKGAQVVCLQELFRSLYFCNTEDQDNFTLAETVPGPFTDELSKLAASLNIVIIASLFEKRTKGIYHNTTTVIDADGAFLGVYRKSHIPDDPGFYEKYYFTPGDDNYRVFDTAYAKIGVLICWDQWYPEAARITALKGAEVLFYPTAIGWEIDDTEENKTEQLQAWQTIQRSHAIANGVYVVAVNRVGREAETDFWGHSFVCNPMGTMLYEGTATEEENAITSIDLDKIEGYRITWPFLRDRRIDTYGHLTKRWLGE